MKPIIKIILDERREKSSKKYPVKLRLTFNRKQMYHPLGIDLTIDEFEKMMANTCPRNLREIKMAVNEFEIKANNIINNLPDFSFRLFDIKFYAKNRNAADIYAFFEDKISKLEKEGKYGSATSYRCTMVSLKKFRQNLSFKEIGEDLLAEFEKWHLDKGNSITTVGIYLRTLRAIFNDAIDDGVIAREYYYPFGKRKYQIPASRNIKKALTLAEIKMIFAYIPSSGTFEEKALDFWKFSYLCNGINMKDIAMLKYKNIDGDFIKFRREKTKFTSRQDSQLISACIIDNVKVIINKWRNKVNKPENYIFDIINDSIDEMKKRMMVQQFIKQVNKYMQIITMELKIDKHVTTYTARHSFATIMKRSGANVEFISESLGHSSIQTTQSYLDSFEDERKKEFAKALINFKN